MKRWAETRITERHWLSRASAGKRRDVDDHRNKRPFSRQITATAFAQGMEMNNAASEQVSRTAATGEDTNEEIWTANERGGSESQEGVVDPWEDAPMEDAPSRVLLYVPSTLEAQADEMRSLLRSMRMQTSQLAYTSEEGAAGLARHYGTEGGFTDIVEQLTDMAGRLQQSIQRDQGANTRPMPLFEWNADPFSNDLRPTHSVTEILFLDLSADLTDDVKKEQIAWILGGGNVVRDIRQAGNLTFVACWTAKEASKMLDGGINKLRKSGIHASMATRARFRDDLHNHEINPLAPTPYYYPFEVREESTSRHGQLRNVRSGMSTTGGTGASSSSRLSIIMEMDGNEDTKKRDRRGSGSESE